MSRILSSKEAIWRGENSAGGVQTAEDAARERSMRNLQDRKTVLLDLRIISSEIRKAQGEKEADEVIQALEEHRKVLLQTFKNLRESS
jgi:precorrin isomerase